MNNKRFYVGTHVLYRYAADSPGTWGVRRATVRAVAENHVLLSRFFIFRWWEEKSNIVSEVWYPGMAC